MSLQDNYKFSFSGCNLLFESKSSSILVLKEEITFSFKKIWQNHWKLNRNDCTATNGMVWAKVLKMIIHSLVIKMLLAHLSR